MGWAVSSNPEPQRFTEAMDWFAARTVITAAEAARLDDDARQRAFWVGGGLQLSQVQRVFDQIAVALDKGESFDQFKKRVAGLLTDPQHAETVFRNATQKAYNAGRYRQLMASSRWRPYLRYTTILDLRRTEICRARDGTTRLAEDPWWQANWPPMHHRCRSTITSLRKAEQTTRPNLPDNPGWGKAPTADQPWKPRREDHDARLFAELERKRTKVRTRRLTKRPEHAQSFWEPEYRAPSEKAPHGYGDAAPLLAYGRAALERALDRTPGELLITLERLQNAGHPSFRKIPSEELRAHPADKPVRGSAFAQQNQALLALAEHARSIDPRKAPAFGLKGDFPEAIRQAVQFYEALLHPGVTRPTATVVSVVPGARAGASFDGLRLVLSDTDGVDIAVHELAHVIEALSPKALKRSLAFLRARTVDEQPQRLRDVSDGAAYEDWEFARKDKFAKPYVGKDYGDLGTEITSMGYEWLARNPEHLVRKDDKDMLFFLLGQLAGK